jgi:hypothetical protein
MGIFKTHKPERLIRQIVRNVPLQEERDAKENHYGKNFEQRTDGDTAQATTAQTEDTGGLRDFSPYSRLLRSGLFRLYRCL